MKILLQSTAILVLLAFVFIEFVYSRYLYANDIYNFDKYQFYSAASEFLATGLPRLTYLPNSSAAEDMLYWTHLLPSLFYSGLIAIINLSYPALEFVRFAELTLLTFAIWSLIRRFIDKGCALVLTAMCPLEPQFHELCVNSQYHRWPVIFGLLSLLVLCPRNSCKNNFSSRNYFWFGFLSALSPLSFVSLGLPIFFGNLLCCVVTTQQGQTSSTSRRFPLTAFFLGSLLPFASLGLYLAVYPSSFDFREFVQILSYYGKHIESTAANNQNSLTALSALIVSTDGLTFFPVGALAVFLLATKRSSLSLENRFLVTATSSQIVGGILLLLCLPSHVYPQRLSWMMPLLAITFATFITIFRDRSEAIAFWGFSLIQMFFQIIFQLFDPNWTAIMAAPLFSAGSAGLFGYWLFRTKFEFNELARLTILIMILIVAAAFVSGPVLTERLKLHLSSQEGNNSFSFPAHSQIRTSLVSLQKNEICPSNVNNRFNKPQWILTNMPIKNFFPSNANLEAIYTYRGLFSGARFEPADCLVVIDRNGPRTPTAFVFAPKLTACYSYRGHDYRILTKRTLWNDYLLYSGAPDSTCQNDLTPIDSPEVSASIGEYLSWRRNLIPPHTSTSSH